MRAAGLFIENVDKVPDMLDGEKAQLAAEAKVIIASRYFDMFRHFGGLPLTDGSFSVSSSYDVPRATVEETVNYMVNLLDEAAAALPWDLSAIGESNWQGRSTKAAALGLKCKVLLFAASPLFTANVPYCTDEPQEAVENRQVWYGPYRPTLMNQRFQACETSFN